MGTHDLGTLQTRGQRRLLLLLLGFTLVVVLLLLLLLLTIDAVAARSNLLRHGIKAIVRSKVQSSKLHVQIANVVQRIVSRHLHSAGRDL